MLGLRNPSLAFDPMDIDIWGNAKSFEMSMCPRKLMQDSTLVDSVLTSYLATISPVVVKSLKRSRELSESDDEGSDPSLVLPPLKRRKLDLKQIIWYKSPRFILRRKKPAKSSRPKFGLPSTRRFYQTPLKPQVNYTTTPPRAEPARVSLGPSPPRMLDDAACGFTIYQETADEEMVNLFTHSASTLNISDDENSWAAKSDLGMENLQPTTTGDSAPSSAKSPVADKKRTPLGDAGSFYNNGYGDGSLVLILDEEELEEIS